MSHQTKDKGDLAVVMALADLRRHGIVTCLPISEHLPFDMVAVMPDMTTLVRLQVKYRKTNTVGTIHLTFRSNYYDSKKIYSKHVDLSHLDKDMKTLIRYRIGMDAVEANSYVDMYAICSSQTGDICYILANSVTEDMKKLTFSESRG